MFFTSLPNEIILQIIIEAVRVRGIKRAQRLRYVSKAWDAAVVDAIIKSGILEYHRRGWQSVHWPRYLVYRALHDRSLFREDTVPTRLYVIRQVARRLESYRNSGSGSGIPAGSDTNTFRGFLDTICTMRLTHLGTDKTNGDHLLSIRMPSSTNRDNTSDYFDEVLLGTAAWLNELGLLKEVLQSMEGVPGPKEHRLHYAISAAAYKGHDEAVCLLLDAIEAPNNKCLAKNLIILSASKGNQPSTLELGLMPTLERMSPGPDKLYYKIVLEDSLNNTTSVAIFKRLNSLIFWRHYQGVLTPWGSRSIRFCVGQMACQGAVPIIDHIIRREGLEWSRCIRRYPVFNSERSPLYLAAQSGQFEAVTYLFEEQGFPLYPEILNAAVKHGNPDVVQFLLRQPDTADYPLGKALLDATERENEEVARMLLSMGPSPRLDCEAKETARQRAKEMELESMETMFLDYHTEYPPC